MVEPLSKRTVVYALPGMDAVRVEHKGAMDIYARDGATERTPLVIIVNGYADPGFEKVVGCKFKDMGWTVSWARLLAASGVVAVTYVNREPEADLHTVLQRFEKRRIGVLASSGHVPLALSLLIGEPRVNCAALCYGYTFGAQEQATQFRFSYPIAGKSVDDLAPDVPLFIARAGCDEMPALNDRLDAFVGAALARNLPITVANHPTAPHAFDLLDDSDMTRRMIRQVLAFLTL